MPDAGYEFVYEVKLIGSIIGQESLNVFHYGAADELLDPSGWCTEFDTTIVALLLPLVADNYEATEITIQEVQGGIQFASKAVTEFGSVSGDCLPPYATFDFTYVRGGARERNGYKRFSGVPESRQANGVANATSNALAATLAVALEQPVGSVGTGLLTPVIKRTKINHVVQTPPKYFTISSVIYSKIGTQNSRKFGHGR
jgi:hypothetical protein